MGLTDSGELPPAWLDAFAAVPRHEFIPETIWVSDGAGLVPLRRAEDPRGWMQRTYPIHQSGPRNLWDEIEAAYHWWRDAGRPDPQRWRITRTPEGQQVTLTQAPPASPADAHSVGF